ncbi:hypothetical protein AB0K93_30480, partial [Streptomyces sp. NPDC052676]|uniref:nSTAND1 domain-containing NTPase n=1 Tax=Streptomyces sp. NPDC052676 TaxID=3154953 RepID=UPI0034205070
MARRAHYSVTALSQAAAGEHLPSLAVALAYVRACGGDLEEWERRWKEASEEAASLGLWEERGRSPYQGLARFEPDDHERFFGREELVAEVRRMTAEHRFSAVFGPSGSGKSSLLRAGLIPALREDSAGRVAAIRILTPGEHPLRTHAGALGPKNADGDTLIVIDQFEEVFTLCRDAAQRTGFIDRLLAAREPDSRLRVVIAVRADFYGHLAEHRALAEAVSASGLLVGPMTAAELREVIVKPAQRAGLIVERELTARLVREVEGEPGGLPLLSHVLHETWRRRRGKMMTLADYEAAGGLHGAIAQTAEDVYAGLSGEQAKLARTVLLRLISPGEGSPDARRPASRSELNTASTDTAMILDRLARARLITMGEDTVELAHEAMITAWPRLHGWIEEDRERLRAHRHLTEAATAWEQMGRDAGALYRGTRLATASEQLPEAVLTPLERDFLTASHAAGASAVRRRRGVLAAGAVLVVIALVASVAAWQQSRTSDRQRQAAESAREAALSQRLAAQSAALADTDSDLASLLAVQAYRASPTAQALERLYAAASVPLRHRLTGHSGPVVTVAFLPHGRTLATGGDSGDIRLWNTDTGRIRKDLSGAHSYTASEFTADGRTMVSVGPGGIELRDTGTGRIRTRFAKRIDVAGAMALSKDGRTLAVTSTTRTTELWDTVTGRVAARLVERSGELSTLVFAPDGRTLATGGFDGEVKLWDATTGRLLRSLTRHGTAVVSMAFSPDGRTLATGSGGGVHLWDVSTARPLRSLVDFTAPAVSMVFSPDSRILATASGDNEVQLWEAATGRLQQDCPGHRGLVRALAFSPDGSTLATGADDRTVRLWEVVPAWSDSLLIGPANTAVSLALSPDGRRLATGSIGARPVRVRNLISGPLPLRLPGSADDTPSLAFSPDGSALATGNLANRGIELWDASTGQRRKGLVGSGSDTEGLAFSPDGHTLAAASDARGVELWDAATGRRRGNRLEHHDSVHVLIFSPDGHTLATGAGDGTVRLWDTASGAPQVTLAGHTDTVLAMAFSPDGHTLATGGRDGTVRLWDTTTGRSRRTLNVRTGLTSAMAFGPDGRTLATGAGDGTVRLWDTASGAPQVTLAGHTDT